MQSFHFSTYLLLLFYFLPELLVRKRGRAKRLNYGKQDKNSSLLVWSWIILGITSTPIANRIGVGEVGHFLPVTVGGFLMMASGAAIRIIAMKTLGRHYTRTLIEPDSENMIRTGIYYHLRHPGYLGTILLFWGYNLSILNIVGLACFTIITVIVFGYRILAEEKLLLDTYGGSYREYMTSTKRLIPFLL